MQRPRPAHDLAIDRANRLRRKRALAAVVDLQDVLQDLLLAGGIEDVLARIGLELADFGSEIGTLGDQVKDLQVELVNACPKVPQGTRGTRH